MVDFSQILTIAVPTAAILTALLLGINKFLINREEKELDTLQEEFFQKQISTIVQPSILNDLKKRVDLHFEFKNLRDDIRRFKMQSFTALFVFLALILGVFFFEKDVEVLSWLATVEFLIALYFFIILWNLIRSNNELNGVIVEMKDIEFSASSLNTKSPKEQV